MRNIIIFRYYKHANICKNKLEILKKQNPDTPIYGIFGGDPQVKTKFNKPIAHFFEDIYVIHNKSAEWKWLNGDITLRSWYKKVGKDIDFTHAFICDWDIILTKPLDKIIEIIDLKGDELGISGLRPLKEVEHRWTWTSKEHHRKNWLRLLEFVKKNYNYNQEPFASLGAGTIYPKEFLKAYSEAKVLEVTQEEQRIPLYAQILGFKLKNNKYDPWWMDIPQEHFNCKSWEIEMEVITRLKDKVLAFHPVTKRVPLELFD